MRSMTMLRDGVMAAEHHGDPDSPIDVLFLHANGLNAGAYRNLFSGLPGGIHVLAIDQRGHGSSDLPPYGSDGDRQGWSDLRDDLLEFLALLDARPAVLAGHSMGATVSLMAAATGSVADRLLLFDPVWVPPGYASSIAAISKNRRRHFATRQEAYERLRGRGAFASWPDEALVDYLDTGLRPYADGFALSCTPEWETSNFLMSVNPLADCLAKLEIPATVLTAATDSAWNLPAGQLIPAGMTLSQIPGATHFLPIELPDLARKAITAEVAAARRAKYN